MPPRGPMSALTINSYVDHHKLILKLRPVMVNELYLAPALQHPAYIFKDEMMHPVFVSGTTPAKDQIQSLIKNGIKEIFLYEVDAQKIRVNLETALTKITRSLSIGDPIENGTKELKLLSINMNNLYQNPHNDQLLKLQCQSTQNLSRFLIDNKKHQPEFFEQIAAENFHFTIAQPMLSSILLLSYLQSIHLFADKEIENLFLASYLKDIGLSMIPRDKFDQNGLTDKERDLFANHANFSTKILHGRIPLTSNYVTIIKHHHHLNEKLKQLIGKETTQHHDDLILGLETTLVGVFDMLVAMINERPYRRKTSLFKSLELIKKLMADDYPQEYKALIIFINQFFKN
jgi:hypothetical protein